MQPGATFDPVRGVVDFPEDTIKEHACGDDRYCFRGMGRFCSPFKDDGVYITVEVSDNYGPFATGQFVVVAASGAADDMKMRAALRLVLQYYPGGYIKKVELPE